MTGRGLHLVNGLEPNNRRRCGVGAYLALQNFSRKNARGCAARDAFHECADDPLRKRHLDMRLPRACRVHHPGKTCLRVRGSR